MGHEHTTRATTMKPSALVIRVRNQTCNAGHRLQESQTWRRGELIEHRRNQRRNAVGVATVHLPRLIKLEPLVPVRRIRRRITLAYFLRRQLEKVFQRQMRKRGRGGKV